VGERGVDRISAHKLMFKPFRTTFTDLSGLKTENTFSKEVILIFILIFGLLFF
jgi:hypothetical protein